MEEQNVAIRLKGFIDSLGLSHSQFADETGIPRPSLSQILSGRNKKVSDIIVGQIHRRWPELSILWLLFGEGDMLMASDPLHDNPSEVGNFESEAENPRESSEHRYESSDNRNEPLENQLFYYPDGSPVTSLPHSRSKGSDNPVNPSDVPEYSNVRALKEALDTIKRLEDEIDKLNIENASLRKQIENMAKNPRKAGHITVYYDDSTFETFIPK